MKLPIGARLPHDFADIPANEPEIVQRNRAIYRITQVVHETPWSCLYRGKKVFRNFEFSKSALSEAADDECLDVLIRTLGYPTTNDREYIKSRREHASFELKQVLGLRRTNSIAEPLDYLEIRNDQDEFAFPRPGNLPKTEPVLVFESIDGQELERWRYSGAFDIPLGLNILGQILDFLSTLHTARFLMNVVAPNAFWIDDLHQIHCLGTESIVDERRAGSWRGLFPNERYAQGFVAPELLKSDTPPSTQSDLYGWATLAWLILIGEHPSRLATSQHQRVARFEPTHREQLRRELNTLTLTQVAAVKRELGVTGTRFELQWPDSFIEGLWSCLESDVSLRPSSVAELRVWWGNPPPQPVPAFLAVKQPGGIVRFVFSTTGLREGLLFQIRRESAQPQQTKGAGDVIWKGAANDRIEIRIPLQAQGTQGVFPPAELRFSIVTTESLSGTPAVSRPTVATWVDGTEQGYRRQLAETYAARTKSLPDEVELLARLDPIETVIEELFDSTFEHVRRWALELLQRHLSSGPMRPASRSFLRERALVDAENDLRQFAAGLLLRTHMSSDAKIVIDLAQRMGGNAVDEMIRAARGFSVFGVSKETIESAIETLEQQHRIVVCPVCHQDLRTRELDGHLISEHRYVPLDGKLLPFGQALTRLWSRVMQHCDATALQELTHHLQQRQSHNVVAAFATALSQQAIFLLQSQGMHQTQAQRQQWSTELGQCLHSNQVARSACWTLLRHEDARVRDLARHTVILTAVSRVIGDAVTPAAFRETIDALVPLPIVNERIETCRQLIELGANQFAGEQCEKDLDLERLVDCPECGTSFPKRGLASHRRLRHQIFEWEGSRYRWESLVPLLLDRTVAIDADAFAARTLTELFIEKYGPAALQPLYQSLRDHLVESLTPLNLSELVTAFASAFGGLTLAPPLSREFLNENHAACQTAGLAIFSSLHNQPAPELMRLVAGRIGQVDVPFVVCQQVAIRLLKTSGIDAQTIRRALFALASRADDGLKGIDLLRALEQWVGPSAAIDVACEELTAKIRMRCPRCDVSMTPPELDRHVRAEHGMILEGRSVRQPWSVVMECLDEYAENPKAELLQRAEEIVDFMSPRKGRIRLWRESLRRGIAPPHYRHLLVESVSKTTDSLCPECWETISSGDPGASELQIDDRGNIKSNLVSLVQLGVRGIWGSVEITPWNGPIPHWSLSRLAASVGTGLLFLIPAVIFGIFSLQGNISARIPAMLLAAVSLISAAIVAGFYRPRSTTPLDVAWEYVVPSLLDTEDQHLGSIQSSFIANLCRASVSRGNPRLRRKTLKRAIQRMRTGVKRGTLPMSHLIEPWILRLEDALPVRHGDAETVLKDMLVQIVSGDLPLQLDTRVTALLSRLSLVQLASGFWHLIVHARTSGLVAVDLVELFRNSPTLRTLLARLSIRLQDLPQVVAVLELEQTGRIPHGMASARQLMSRDRTSFATNPNLLARSELTGRFSDHDAIVLCPGELLFRTRRFPTCPDVLVREKRQFVQTGWTYQRKDGTADLRYSNNPPTGYEVITGYTLCVGSENWSYKLDPEPIAAKLRKAGSFLFGDLEILAEKLERDSFTSFLPQLLSGPTIRCPRCQSSLRFRKGAISERSLESSPVLEEEIA